MKVCIVTVYNSENCGSYWQAFALYSHLRQRGCEISFLERKLSRTSHSPVYVGSQVLKNILKGRLRLALSKIKQYWVFDRSIKSFETVKKITSDFDLCIIGSDTLWNLEEPYFEDNSNIFFGSESEAKKTITYAISAANSTSYLFQKHPKLINDIAGLDAVSVRDNHTYSIVEELTGITAPICIDPTLLLTKEIYQRYCFDLKINNFLFIYYFGKIPSDLQQQIRSYASSKKLQIVVMGRGMKGDYNFDVFSPFTFISCFNNASYVVTNTFHGVMFTMIFEKQALFNSCGKEKILDVLKEYTLQNRDYAEKSCKNFMDSNIDYDYVRKLISKNRNVANQYISNFTGGLKDGN